MRNKEKDFAIKGSIFVIGLLLIIFAGIYTTLEESGFTAMATLLTIISLTLAGLSLYRLRTNVHAQTRETLTLIFAALSALVYLAFLVPGLGFLYTLFPFSMIIGSWIYPFLAGIFALLVPWNLPKSAKRAKKNVRLASLTDSLESKVAQRPQKLSPAGMNALRFGVAFLGLVLLSLHIVSNLEAITRTPNLPWSLGVTEAIILAGIMITSLGLMRARYTRARKRVITTFVLSLAALIAFIFLVFISPMYETGFPFGLAFLYGELTAFTAFFAISIPFGRVKR
ncbi:hypothetical protein BK816_08560 [Boudabousia tangfeifanii]|uniref:Uncharacterized protein n=1 Tax=Boudabousia tangfeifanii TaxID=1912795 RepID=A0A1D9MLZ8_9ACTO|nr:hypothetical protein [Boudabousia tangfeifanii]AOZ73322.1 hypothetical protein BK816_08560 [Boudabousia tangfeifanii]